VQRFDLVLDWVANVQFAGPCLALDRGLYRAAGIDLRLEPWTEDGRSIIAKTLGRAVPAAGSAEDNLVVSARAAGVAVRGLAAMFQTTPLVVMTRPEAGVGTLGDLRGKRVAMHCDGIRILEALLAEEGVDRGDVEIAEVTHDLGNLASGRWDAVQGYAVSEPLELASRGLETATLTLRGATLHPYAQVLFADDGLVARAPGLYRAMLDATFAGWRAAIAEPAAAARAIRAVGAPMADSEREMAALAAVAALVRGDSADEARGLGRIDPARWASNVACYRRAGIVPADQAPLAALDAAFWQGEVGADRLSRHPG
jgi:NitT/TauT family transport system substrate-binding protein